MYFTGIRPWSWYIATTTSNSPTWRGGSWRARMKMVSGAQGPEASMPSAWAARMAGAMVSTSSLPNRPPSPACGLSPATAMRGFGWPHKAALRWVMRRVSSTLSNVTCSMAWRSETWMVTSTVRNWRLASIMRTGAGGWPAGAPSACSNSV